MHYLGVLLSSLGSRGPFILIVSLVTGAMIPASADFGYRLLPASAFLLIFGSFLTAGLATSDERIEIRTIIGGLLWVGFCIPAFAALALSIIPFDPSMSSGILLSLSAPPVGSAAAIAAMLGLKPRLSLVISICLTVLVPLSMPFIASQLNLGIGFKIDTLAVRLFVIVGSAALIASLILHVRSWFIPILPNQHAATGVAVVGLVIVGLAMSEGVRRHLAADPALFVSMLGAAVLINIGLFLLSTLLFWHLGLRVAATIGLVSGNRNVTLAWAASAGALSIQSEAYLAACVIPVLALPLFIKTITALYARASRLNDAKGLRA